MQVHRWNARQFIGLGAALALVAGAGVVVLARSGSGGDDAARYAGVTEQPDERSATQVAAATHRRIEVAGLRSSTGQVFAQPDGSYVAEEGIEPVRARRADGSWGPIDTTLQPQADGTYRTTATAAAVTISGGGTAPIMAIRDGKGHELALTWPAPLPKPSVKGDVATFAEVLPGVDLLVRGDKAGARKVLLVKTPEAARNPALREITFGLRTTGVQVKESGAGTLSATDADGKLVFATPTSSIWDAATATSETGARQDGEWEPSDAARIGRIGVRVDGDKLVMTPDRTVLEAPDAAFPLRIDPQFNWVGQNAWQLVSTQDSSKSYWNGGDRPNDPEGKVSVGRTKTGSSQYNFRAFMRFDTGFFRGKTVLDADFYTVLSYSWSWACNETNYKVGIYQYSGMNPGLTWNNHGGGWGAQLAARSETHGNSSGQCPGDLLIATDVTGLAQTASSQGWADMQFGLRSLNESCDSTNCMGWRRFKESGTAPDGGAVMRLAVRYNVAPDAATDIQVDGKPCNGSIMVGAGASYNVSAMLRDGDNDNVTGQLWLYNSDNSVLQTLTAGAVGSGTRAGWQVDPAWLVSGRTYPMKVLSGDGETATWSTACNLTMDNIRPANPDVDSTDYPDDGVTRGAVGRTGAFLLKVPADAAKVYYGSSDPPTTELALTGANPTVKVTPTAQGVNFVHVQVADAAGNRSDVYHYQYVVGAPTDPVGHWKLDEGTGTSLADTAYPGNPDDVNKPLTITGGGMAWAGDGNDARLLHEHYLRSNGATQRVSTSGPVLDTTRSYTVAAWVRLNSLPTENEPVVSQGGTSVGAFGLMYGINSKAWVFHVSTADNIVDGSKWAWAIAPTPPPIGVWTHLAGVYDAGAGKARLYVNGVQVAEATVTSTWKANGPFDVGSIMWDGQSGSPFNGDIDDVRAYNRVVMPVEFAGLTKRAETWLAFEDGTTSTLDRTGNARNGTPYGGVTLSTGFTGHGVRLNGSSNYVTTNGPAVRTDGSFTVSAWARPLRGESTQVVLSQEGSLSSEFQLRYSSANQRWEFRLLSADTFSPTVTAVVASTDPARLGEWTHVTGVYDAERQQIQLWVNGAQQGTVSNITPRWNATGTFVVGRGKRLLTSDYFYGDVDEVMAHTGALNGQEIGALADSSRRLPASQQLSGDFTGDGKADSVVVQAFPDHQMKLWQLTTAAGVPLAEPIEVWSSQYAPWTMPAGWDHDSARWNAADFDGDGKADISLALRNDALVSGAWVRNTQVWIFRSSGSGFFEPELAWESLDGAWPLESLKIETGDVNNDHKADLVLVREDGSAGFTVFTLAGNGSGLNPPVQWYNVPTSEANADPRRITFRVGDFDKDGYADLVQLYQQDTDRTTIWVSYSNGTAFTARQQLWDSGDNGLMMYRVKPVVADVTGDGKADVVAYYNDGTTRRMLTWVSNGRSGLAGPATWLDSGPCGSGCSPAMDSWANLSIVPGNYDGDLDIDLLGIQTLPTDPKFTLWGFVSTGTAFVPPASRYTSSAHGM